MKKQQVTSSEEGKQSIKVVPLLAVLLIGAFVATLNDTLLNVAITPIMNALDVEASTAQWLTTGYLLVVAVLMPVSSYFIQRFTVRQIFITAMGLFALGTAVSGFAPVFSILLIGRLIQATGTCVLIPLLTSVILNIIPQHRRGGVMGMLGLVIMFAPAIGPTLSGVIIDYLSWRWLFFLVLPIALFAILFATFALKNVTEPTKPKLDIGSMVLSVFGFGGIVFGFSSAGGIGGWTDPKVIISIVIGLVALFVFVTRQRKLKEPMLDMRAFTYPKFSLAVVVIMIVMMTMYATMIVLPMFLLQVFAFDGVTVGLIMLPGGILNAFISPFVGKMFDKFGPRAVLLPGILILAISIFSFSMLDQGAALITIVIVHSLLMVATAMILMPAQTVGLNQLPRHLYPDGSAIVNTTMKVAGAIGTALFISIMAMGEKSFLKHIPNPSGADQTAAFTAGVHRSFIFGLIFVGIAFIIALFIKSEATSPVKEGQGE